MNVADLRRVFRTLAAIIAKPSSFFGTLLLLAAPAMGADLSANWPQFRGPGALGVADHPSLPDRWSTNENVAWKSFTASPWAANGKIFALSEDGDTYVFQAGPDYKLLHTNSLDEMCLATPAMAGNRLLIRTLTKLYCFQAAK